MVRASDFEENNQFKELINNLLKSSRYKSCVLGHHYGEYLVLVDADLYVITPEFEISPFPLSFFDEDKMINVGGFQYDDINYLRKKRRVKRPNSNKSLSYRIDDRKLNKLREYVESLRENANDFKKDIHSLWIKHQYELRPYLIAYYKKRFDNRRNFYLRINSWVRFEKYHLNNPRALLSQYHDLDIECTMLPEDIRKLIAILKQKSSIEESNFRYVQWIVAYGLRQISIESNIELFEEDFPEVKKSHSTNIVDLLLTLDENALWHDRINENMDRFVMYYLGKLNLINKISSNQLENITESVKMSYEKLKIEKETILLERELEAAFEDSSHLTSYTINDIDLMSGVEFESFCGKLFEKLNYIVEYTPASGDQGIDLIATKGSQSIGIQVKRYSDKVTNKAVQEVAAGINHYKLQKGLVITSNYYTNSAKDLADSNNITLWDRDLLEIKIKEAFG